MSASKYQVLLRVVELGSVTRAAEELGYTQSGVSHIISGLENELQLVLLHRSRNGVTLTDAGRRLLPHMRAVVREDEALRQTAASIRGLKEGTLRLGAFSSVSVSWLPAILKAFSEAEPGIDIRLSNGDYHDIDGWLADGTVDLAFVTLPRADDGQVIPLKDDPLMVILPKDHPLAGLEAFPIRQLESEPFISLLESSSHDTQRVLQGHNLHLKTRFTTKDDYALISMVENGLGISIVPKLLLRGLEDRVAAIPPETHIKRTIALALPENPTPAALCLAAFISDWVSKNA